MEPIVDLDRRTLSAADRELVMRKNAANRLDFALLLKFFQSAGRYPALTTEIDLAVVEHLAAQIDIFTTSVTGAQGRTLKRMRTEIRAACGFREASVEDAAWPAEYLCERSIPQTRDHERLVAFLVTACRERRIEPPADERVARVVRHALRIYG